MIASQSETQFKIGINYVKLYCIMPMYKTLQKGLYFYKRYKFWNLDIICNKDGLFSNTYKQKVTEEIFPYSPID